MACLRSKTAAYKVVCLSTNIVHVMLNNLRVRSYVRQFDEVQYAHNRFRENPNETILTVRERTVCFLRFSFYRESYIFQI